MSFLTALVSLLTPAKAQARPKELPLARATFVGHGQLTAAEEKMKAVMDGLLLPEGSKWFFLQPGKNEVKLHTPVSADKLRDLVETQLQRKCKVTRTENLAGLHAMAWVRFEWVYSPRPVDATPSNWMEGYDPLNEWGIEVVTTPELCGHDC